MATTQTLLSFEEFAALPEEEGVWLELDEGVVIEMPAASFPHGSIQANVAAELVAWRRRTGADIRVSLSAAFRLAPRTVRLPDVCLIRNSTYESMEKTRGVLQGAPDLAVEVISPSNSARDLNRKVEQYLRAGAQAVWLLYDDTRYVIVHRQGEIRKYESGQVLEEPGLLPGFSVPVDELFAGV
jgi:Uma2 family endonuclease